MRCGERLVKWQRIIQSLNGSHRYYLMNILFSNVGPLPTCLEERTAAFLRMKPRHSCLHVYHIYPIFLLRTPLFRSCFLTCGPPSVTCFQGGDMPPVMEDAALDSPWTMLSPSPILTYGVISDYSGALRKISESSCLLKLSRPCSQATRCHMAGTTPLLLTFHPTMSVSCLSLKMKVSTPFASCSCIDVDVVRQTLVLLKFD